MVWLEKADGLALSDTANLWNSIRDGKKLTRANRPTVGFRVTKHFTSPTLKSRFLPGMQGQVLFREGSGVYVQVRDLFDAKGQFLKDWIHQDAIEIGTKLYGTWEIDICGVPRTSSKLTPNELAQLKDPKHKHLALGISTFLKKLIQTNPLCFTDTNRDRLGSKSGSKIPWITVKVIEGIERAGLVSVFNNPEFTIEELAANAALDCSAMAAQDVAGLYFRFYTEPKANQPKKDCSLYVGQSWNLHERYNNWVVGKQHEELVGRADSVQMRALCVPDPIFYGDHRYIVEQLLTSLLQTYRQDLLDRVVDVEDFRGNSHQKNCTELDKIATAAANESGWTGAVQRESFWEGSYASCAGLNYQSPISESPVYERTVWLRTDGWMPDPDQPSKSIAISNFTREVPRKMTVLTPSGKSSSQAKSFSIFHLQSDVGKGPTYQMGISRTLKNYSPDGVEWPIDGSFFNITFEVRTDWKPHPFSWARLPLIGPFEDWDRANSWAMSIDWTDASGQSRSKYLHCQMPLMMMSKESNGSIQPYARGIEVSIP
jgi:hypothetical protein